MPRIDRPTTPKATDTPRTVVTHPPNDGARPDGMKINIYGEAKSGKTRLVYSFPKPILYIGQDGSKSIATHKAAKPRYVLPGGTPVQILMRGDKQAGADLVVLRSSNDLDEAIRWGRDHYRTVALDMAIDLQRLHVKEIAGMVETPQRMTFGIISIEQWGVVAGRMIDQIYKLLNLTETHGIHTPVIAHERNFKEDDKHPNAALIAPRIGSDVTKAVKKFLDGACDYICQCCVGEEVVSREVDTGVEGQKEVITDKTGRYEYRLRIGKHPVFTTGFRCLADELPDYIVNPTYEKICRVILGEKV